MNKKKDEQNMFTTKNYVSIQTLLIHNWKLHVNKKHHFFISKRYVPIKNWDTMRLHILYTIQFVFYLNSIFQTSYV
jgi:hypothetical protein